MRLIEHMELNERKFWLYQTTLPGTAFNLYVLRCYDGLLDYFSATTDLFDAVATCRAWLNPLIEERPA